MSFPMKPRHVVLALLLAGVLAASFWPQDEDGVDDVVEVVARPQGQHQVSALPPVSTQPHAQPHTQPDTQPVDAVANNVAGDLRFAMAEAANLFPPQSFRPPPKPVAPAPVLPPPPPMAPPVPFTFVGAWHEDGKETVFLERGSQLITTHAGETLPGGWRLDTVSPAGLTFTYVSLNQQRTLRIGP